MCLGCSQLLRFGDAKPGCEQCFCERVPTADFVDVLGVEWGRRLVEGAIHADHDLTTIPACSEGIIPVNDPAFEFILGLRISVEVLVDFAVPVNILRIAATHFVIFDRSPDSLIETGALSVSHTFSEMPELYFGDSVTRAPDFEFVTISEQLFDGIPGLYLGLLMCRQSLIQ